MKRHTVKYIYPKLPAVKDCWLFRVGGNGLANCLFVYAKAIIKSGEAEQIIITPTWFNLSIGTYVRSQTDKRHYTKLFKSEMSILRKIRLLLFNQNIEVIEGISDYFKPLKGENILIRNYIFKQLSDMTKVQIPAIEDNIIGIHIRLGDYPQEKRVPLIWYKNIVLAIQNIFNSKYKFYLYSDGTDEELGELLELDNLERKDYGLAIIDLWALSQSTLIIGSDSTFSAWSAYLNQVPIIFQKRHFPPVLDDLSYELVVGNKIKDISEFLHYVL